MIHTRDKGTILFYFKIGLLLFWFAWFGIASLSNLMDLLSAHYGVLLAWKFHSGNYLALGKVLSIYSTPTYILSILFYMDIIIQAVSAILFFIAAFCTFRAKAFCWKYINLAFAVSISLWAVFLIMEEIFLAYPYESTHMTLCIFELLSLLALHLLSHKDKTLNGS